MGNEARNEKNVNGFIAFHFEGSPPAKWRWLVKSPSLTRLY